MQQIFVGLGAAPPVEITASNATNIDLATVFGSDWTENKNKVYIVPSGVTLGATSTSNYAITVSTGMGGNLEINVSGTVMGYGGSGGSGGYSPGYNTRGGSSTIRNGNPGGAGGPAINVKSANVTVNNLSGGQISGGGGGGGGGGTGQLSDYASWFYVGGAGGDGGIGQGYNGGPGGGSNGGPASPGGPGGAGGPGGTYGQAGSNGNNGQPRTYGGGMGRGSGGSGGAAGAAIYSDNSTSWTNGTTSGTYHGSYT